MKKKIFYMVVAFTILSMVNKTIATPRWSATTPQVGESETRQVASGYMRDCENVNHGNRYCVANNLSGPFVSKDAAAWNVAQTILKDRECKRDWESNHIIYEKDGKYYYGTPQAYTNQRYGESHAPVDLNHPYVQAMVQQGYNIVASIHPHPNGSWYSLTDAKTSKKLSLDIYLLPCYAINSINRYNKDRPIIYFLDHNDGIVYPIIRGRRDVQNPIMSARGQYANREGYYQGVIQYAELGGAQSNAGLAEVTPDDPSIIPKEVRQYSQPGEKRSVENPEHSENVRDPEMGNGSLTAMSQTADKVSTEKVSPDDTHQKVADVVAPKEKDDEKQVGVKGWCRCGSQKGRIYSVGGGDAKGNQQGPYTYSLCGRCGKIERPKDTDGSLWILDNEMERKRRLEKRNYSHKDFKELERKLLAIPDGQIVIPGKCTCASPDPTKTGFVDNDEYYICCNCGRVYVPVGHSVPIGPTAKREMFGR